MVSFYHIKDINLGEPLHFGHEIYSEAKYAPCSNPKKSLKIIFKKNKYGNPQYSCLETAFSQLARLFLSNNYTPEQRLVVDDSNNIVGLAVQHLTYVIEKKESLANAFFSLKRFGLNYKYEKKIVKSAEKIPFYFLDRLPQGYFKTLVEAEKSQILNIDYSSLASIFATSYTLEEDDLHKGNFGFYLVEKEGKPQVVFFKIDHDLMFADSIMSFYFSRLTHWGNGEHAFDITAQDLLNFPNLRDSANSYWPTKINFFSNPLHNKAYHSEEEVEAFAHLKNIPEFNKAKWLSFYKHILVPQELIESSLKGCFDERKPGDRALIALITQAMMARQSRLRAVLFSLKEFRSFVSTLNKDESTTLLNELVHSYEGINKQKLEEQVTMMMLNHQKLCHRDTGIVDGDTPLHIAIKMGDYRYEETIQSYGHLIDTKNSDGQTPLDLALQMIHSAEKLPKDIRKDLRLTMRHLLANGAKQSEAFKVFNKLENVEAYRFPISYMARTAKANTYSHFKDILRDIGEDHRLCLKYKKNLAIECIKKYIKEHRNIPEFPSLLIQLKKDINGHSTPSQSSGLQYIRQLRSRLWIVRIIRGLFGWTSTQSEINHMIDRELDKTQSKDFGYFSFFGNSLIKEEYKDVISAVLNIR